MFRRDVRPARLSSEGAPDYSRGRSEAKSPVTISLKSNPDGVAEMDMCLAGWGKVCYIVCGYGSGLESAENFCTDGLYATHCL